MGRGKAAADDVVATGTVAAGDSGEDLVALLFVAHIDVIAKSMKGIVTANRKRGKSRNGAAPFLVNSAHKL
jgi:hypothetical protein